MQRTLLSALLALPLALPLAAEAQSFRCVGKDGRKHYGQSMPPQCVGLPAEQLNAQGLVVRRIDPQASADERAKKETDEADRRKQAAQAKDQGRRDNALLATYSSEKDVDLSRARALEDNNRVVRELEAKIADLRKKRAAPGADAKGIDMELKTQEDLLAGKKKETERINARYDDDKKRYAEITKRGK